jgi:hypothetical protein
LAETSSKVLFFYNNWLDLPPGYLEDLHYTYRVTLEFIDGV